MAEQWVALQDPADSVRDRGQGPSAWLWWCAAGLAVWCLLLVLWTVALLTPDPVQVARALLPDEVEFPAAKLLHVCAYGFLAALTSCLRPLGRYRWLFLALLSLHGMGTEYFQQFVPGRCGCLQDVAIDHVGILLGAVLAWRSWINRPASAQPPA
jgi:VanZ family protein